MPGPDWLWWSLAGLLALAGLSRWALLTRRLARPDHCEHCGYPRPSVSPPTQPPSPCPECGKPAPAPCRSPRLWAALRPRAWRVALVLFLAAAVASQVPRLWPLGPLGASPTWLLMLAREVPGLSSSPSLEQELYTRLLYTPLWDWQYARLAPGFVGVRWPREVWPRGVPVTPELYTAWSTVRPAVPGRTRWPARMFRVVVGPAPGFAAPPRDKPEPPPRDSYARFAPSPSVEALPDQRTGRVKLVYTIESRELDQQQGGPTPWHPLCTGELDFTLRLVDNPIDAIGFVDSPDAMRAVVEQLQPRLVDYGAAQGQSNDQGLGIAIVSGFTGPLQGVAFAARVRVLHDGEVIARGEIVEPPQSGSIWARLPHELVGDLARLRAAQANDPAYQVEIEGDPLLALPLPGARAAWSGRVRLPLSALLAPRSGTAPPPP